MNLQLLNSGTPNEKLWLNPVCGNLLCNDVNCKVLNCPEIVGVNITPSTVPTRKVFKLGTPIGSQLPLPAVTFSPADTIFINNPYITLGPLVRNGYLPDFDQFILITISYTLTSPIVGGSGESNANVYVNNVLTSIQCRLPVTAVGVQQFSVCCSGVVRISAGDYITNDFLNNGFGPGWRYEDFSFSGIVL
jgi:hypothetical protein